MLTDNQTNRKKLQKVHDKIESEIAGGTFVYANFFPESKALKRLAKQAQVQMQQTATAQAVEAVVNEKADAVVSARPIFKDFANQWFGERSIEWRRSHIRSLISTLNGHLIPHFGSMVVGRITKSDVLEFRTQLAKVQQFRASCRILNRMKSKLSLAREQLTFRKINLIKWLDR